MGVRECSFGYLDDCWRGRPAIKAAMALAYLGLLGSLGALLGLAKGAPPAFPDDLEPGYLNFDLEIRHAEGGSYQAVARAIDSIEALFAFSLPPALLRHEPPGVPLPRGGPVPGAGALEALDPKEVGRALFDLVFGDDVRSGFRATVRCAEVPGCRGVRLRLRLSEVPELADLPWECLYDHEQEGFLACANRTTVVRYLPVSKPVRRVGVVPPIRVLVMVSTPEDYEPLATAHQEARDLRLALARLVKRKEVEVESVEPTLDALQRRLRGGEPVHVFHFVGHGGYSETGGQGELVFQDEAGHGQHVGAESLAGLLKDSPSLRLAVLNACHGASARGADVFTGTAQKLVEHGGVPAVVAMRREVADETASLFARKFYEAFAERKPVDACIGEARKALAARNNQEWGTPVLYLRAADGQLFTAADREAGARS